MPVTEVCGEPTAKGPCTMKKGHEASYHRHREYKRVYWRVRSGGSHATVVAAGDGRVPLNYAISNALLKYDKITVEVEQANDD